MIPEKEEKVEKRKMRGKIRRQCVTVCKSERKKKIGEKQKVEDREYLTEQYQRKSILTNYNIEIIH